jgi:hypothetical protein
MAGLPAQYVTAREWLQLKEQLKTVLSARVQAQALIAACPALNVAEKGLFRKND